MNITISGASGFIGRHLLKTLSKAGHGLHVLSRHAGTNLPPGVRISVWDPLQGPPPAESLSEADAIIHLAGESLAQRWTAEAKQRIRESRVTGTRNLVEALARLPRKPEVLICASGVGYYGSRGDDVLTESSTPGSGFLPDLCVAWESEAQAAEAFGMRVVRVRTGFVLDARGGAFPRMLGPFRMGAGGRLGNGKQWMSWIHLEDLVGLFQFAIESQVRGPLNGVAPYPTTNSEFTRELAHALRRPAVFPMPGFVLRLLFGEMADVLLDSQRVVPGAAEAAGFRFRFPQLAPALTDLLR
jgi:uncharacterized protein (TIGR01777 family)